MKCITLLAIALPLCAFVACETPVDLSAVQEYAKATEDASSSFKDIAEDFHASCLRRHDAYLLMPRNLGSRALRHAQIQLAPGYLSTNATPEPAPTPVPGPPGYVDDKTCAEAGGIDREWRAHNEIVLGYVRELGAIAKVDVVPSLVPDPLGTPLVSANIISSAQFEAFSQLATDISTMVVVGDQRALIAKLTKTTNQPLHDAVDALKLVDAAYAQELWFEYGQTEGGYEVLLDRELQARAKAAPAEQFLLSAEISEQRTTELVTLQNINEHREASIDYASVLDGIVQTHQDLLDASTKNASLADYVGIFKTNVLPLYRDVQSLKAAVK